MQRNDTHVRGRAIQRLGVVAAISIGLVVGAVPIAAFAGVHVYASHYEASEFQILNSPTGTVKGGTAAVTSNVVRVYTQTIIPGGGITASSYADNAAVANLAHLPVSGAKERCFWDYLGGTIPRNPTFPTTCKRTY